LFYTVGLTNKPRCVFYETKGQLYLALDAKMQFVAL